MTIGTTFVNPYLAATPAPAQPSQPAPAPSAPAQPAPPKDKKSIGRTILELPRKVIEGTAGAVGGVVGVAYHVLPGAVEGVAEGLTSYRGSNGTGWYTTVLLAESIGTGATIGTFVGGPVGAAIGAGAGLVGGVIYRALEGHADVPKHFVQEVETKVDTAIAANTDGTKVKIAVQNMVQGGIIGTAVGAKEGWKVGVDAGKGTVSGVLDVAEGVAEGIYEAIRGHK